MNLANLPALDNLLAVFVHLSISLALAVHFALLLVLPATSAHLDTSLATSAPLETSLATSAHFVASLTTSVPLAAFHASLTHSVTQGVASATISVVLASLPLLANSLPTLVLIFHSARPFILFINHSGDFHLTHKSFISSKSQ
ncbi:MAG: hypothetical protein J6S85_09945 [Methanobrevibacter sp.]|nr:hypothetical protein [Methanobrevibacter sp.]